LNLFRNNHTSIEYSDSGKGIPIVLLHGYLETHDIWDDFAEELSKYFRIISLDIPGHGKSELSNKDYSLEKIATAINELLVFLYIEKALFIGHSMGGYIMLAYVEKYSEKVSGMVFMHSHSFADTASKATDRDREIDFILKGKFKLIVKNSIHRSFAEINENKFNIVIEKTIDQALEFKPDLVVHIINGMKNRKERTHVIEASPLPKLFIIGMKDRLLPVEKVLLCAAKAENKKVVLLEHSGHMGFIEEFEIVFKEVKQFIYSL
jgi:pimeloyl-ACP methyl ester carboxylesterase